MLFSLFNMFLRPFLKFLRRQKCIRVSPVQQTKGAHATADHTEARPSGNGGVELPVSASTAAAAKAMGRNSTVLIDAKARARMHWAQALERVKAFRNERYMSEKDVLKAVNNSKFQPNMEVGRHCLSASWSIGSRPFKYNA